MISEILSKHLKKKIDQITADIQRNFYQTAEEALKYGLIDTIISNKEDKMGTDNKDNLHCSFCGKAQKEVKKLIAGPTVYICNECVDLCNEIIDDEDVKDIESELERKFQSLLKLENI
ncbi:hypothetical protein CM15mP43_11790 [bacterium]|nr:MAG: hypothetical protein CM15mP43_11790 [bacterium]